MSRTHRKNGFTLLELIVVITLMGVVTGFCTTIFYKMNDAWKITRIRTELDKVAERCFNDMRKDFSDVLSTSVSGVSLQGNNNNVIMPVLAEIGSRDIRAGSMVRYNFNKMDGTLTRYTGGLYEKNINAGATPLIEGVVDLRIDFIGKGPAGSWKQLWTGNELPIAARVSLALKDLDAPYIQISRKAVFPIHVN